MGLLRLRLTSSKQRLGVRTSLLVNVNEPVSSRTSRGSSCLRTLTLTRRLNNRHQHHHRLHHHRLDRDRVVNGRERSRHHHDASHRGGVSRLEQLRHPRHHLLRLAVVSGSRRASHLFDVTKKVQVEKSSSRHLNQHRQQARDISRDLLSEQPTAERLMSTANN